MKVIITKNYEEMSEKAYEIVRDVIKANPNAVLGLATGSSPIGLYDDLVKAYERGEISFKNIRTVNLDEYVGLDYSSDQSYVYFMRKNLFERVDIDLANTNLPDGKAKDLEAECARYTKLVEGMQQDVQVLGLGSNGHIAFNALRFHDARCQTHRKHHQRQFQALQEHRRSAPQRAHDGHREYHEREKDRRRCQRRE